jgi:hypothetical protein
MNCDKDNKPANSEGDNHFVLNSSRARETHLVVKVHPSCLWRTLGSVLKLMSHRYDVENTPTTCLAANALSGSPQPRVSNLEPGATTAGHLTRGELSGLARYLFRHGPL